ncbi:divalent metal cation transporter [Cupriavidus sp. D39]|uniref:divalent metal cation transporter n=1 Tax=Cupriavidus sp. D39 TaxID=2997877 RepID=UPI002D1E472B|nr:divalent metal cation transporter [Cupriavidus sp. D39]
MPAWAGCPEEVSCQTSAPLLGAVGLSLCSLGNRGQHNPYAVAEAFRWHRSLEATPSKAKAFYLVLAAVMVIGTMLCLLPLDPFKMLYWSAVLNGVAAAPVMVMLQPLSRSRAVMGQFDSPRGLQAVAWIATAAMCLAIAGLAASMFL